MAEALQERGREARTRRRFKCMYYTQEENKHAQPRTPTRQKCTPIRKRRPKKTLETNENHAAGGLVVTQKGGETVLMKSVSE